MEYFKNARTRSLTNIDIMISIIPGSVFKVKKIIIVSKINRFKSARIGGVVITMFEFVIYLKALATILITILVIVSFFGYLGFVFRILKAEGQLSWTGGLGICTDCGEYIFHAWLLF